MLALIARNLKKQFLRPETMLNPLIFFILVCFIYSFGQSQEVRDNQLNSLSVMLVSVILAYCIAITYIFEEDFNNGTLQMIFLNSQNKSSIILAKIVSNIISYGFAFAFICPLSSVFFKIQASILLEISCSIILVTVVLSMVSVMIAALIIGLKNGGLIATIISIPLFLPVIILSLGFYENLINGSASLENFTKNILALTLIYLPLSLFSGAYCIKISAEE